MSDENTVTAEGFIMDVLSSLPRRDQKNWGLIYVNGLNSVKGKKTIQRMASLVEGKCADQSLQQFVNQSPWEWLPVRHRLAEAVAADSPPLAWALYEVAFPKTGRHSVAVEHQFVSSYGKATNCQLGFALCMVTARGVFPVHWCLTIPPAWDTDRERRKRSCLPDTERHRSTWECILSMVDEVNNDWGMPWLPLVADLRDHTGTELLVDAFQARGMAYLLRVGGEHPVHPVSSLEPRSSSGLAAVRQPVRLSGLTRLLARRPRRIVTWRNSLTGGVRRSQFVIGPVWSVAPQRRPLARDTAPMPPVQAIVNWPLGTAQPQAYWLTSLVDRRVDEIMRMVGMTERNDRDVLGAQVGLYDFEGRSYPGWHHHMTLVSIAHAHRLLHGGDTGEQEGREPSPVGMADIP